MSQYLVELYTPNTKWKALNTEQRMRFLGAIGTAMSGLSSMGVEVLTLTEIEPGLGPVNTSEVHQRRGRS